MQRHLALGYHIVRGQIEIDEESAKIVTSIFEKYVEGTSMWQIAREMMEQGVKNANNGPNWTHVTVGNILKNERYLGSQDYPAIIDKELFYQAQLRRERVSQELGRVAQPNSFGKRTIFSGKLVCGICGQPYKRYVEHSGQPGQKRNWKCRQYIKRNRVFCRNRFLPDEEIKDSFQAMVHKLTEKPGILRLKRPEKREPYSREAVGLSERLRELGERPDFPAKEMVQVIYERAVEQYRASSVYDWDYQTGKIEEALIAGESDGRFDEALFQKIVKKITVQSDGNLEFELINGLKADGLIQTNRERRDIGNAAENRNRSKKEHIHYTG